MTNKEFDQWLRESLSSVRHELDPQDWDQFVHRVEESESELDSGFDNAIHDSMKDYQPNMTPNWEHMEEMLEAEEVHFDQHVKQSIENFEVPYNPTTWPTLHERLSEDERMRRKLVYVKILEIVAIFIVFLTFYNFFPVLQSTFREPAENRLLKEKQPQTPIANSEHKTSSTEQASVTIQASSADVSNEIETVAAAASASSSNTIADHKIRSSLPSTANRQLSIPFLKTGTTGQVLASQDRQGAAALAFATPTEDNAMAAFEARTMTTEVKSLGFPSVQSLASVQVPPGLTSLLKEADALQKMSRVRFGMLSSIDVNTLFFPEEHFYSQGRHINFSEKEIVAGGYSAGASLLLDFKTVMIETGFNYSSKTFGPDRKLFIGSSVDRHTLDFDNITLNVVSLPLYLHWKLDRSGLWRIYTTSGASMHVIANANYDLIAENIYTSAAVQDPQQLVNQREVQRVREHMRDGAKFSSKGYITIAGGFGVERYLNSRISIFAQPLYQYQISFFGLIDQNGKHLQNGSLLFGTRISL